MKEMSAERTAEGNVPKTDNALPLWTATSILCLKKKPERESLVYSTRRRPRDVMSFVAPGPKEPNVSTATRMKAWECRSSEYFTIFRLSATDAAAPARKIVLGKCEGASVSGQVKSHSKGLPWDQGIRVEPSGRLPSPLIRPGGSKRAEIPRLRIVRSRMSFTA